MRKPAAKKFDRPSHWIEIEIGRSLAAFVYPYAAWRRASPMVRLRNAVAYVLIGYITVLGVLIIRALAGFSS